MSNYRCNECGAIYIDNGIKGYKTIQSKTTDELITHLKQKIITLQESNKVLRENLQQKEKELCNLYAEINAANTAAAGNLALYKDAELKLQTTINQYNAVVEQNKSLQSELINLKR